MTEHELHRRVIALYDRFTHETHDRRAFMAKLTRLAGGAVAANALLFGIAANPAAASIIAPNDPRVRTIELTWPTSTTRKLKGYSARPAAARGRLPVVVVVHENRGLNEHIRDITRRIALEGFTVVAPDFLSSAGGTPAGDEDKARDMIGRLNLRDTIADGVATIRLLQQPQRSTGRVGAVGFCWGGALVDRLAVAAGNHLAAGVAYYGPPPPPAEAAKVKAPLLLHYAGLDERVNASAGPWVAALKTAGVAVTSYEYAGVDHAFNNDTALARYNAEAAALAWQRTIAFLKQHLV
jgi:carboxymethylenebutenolidase